MFLTPLPRTLSGKVQFVLVFGLSLVLGILCWPFVAVYEFLCPEKLAGGLDYTEEDSFDDENASDKEE